MGPLLDQLPALLGVLVGALATYLGTGLNERARWRRDQRVRWDQPRLEAYASLSRALKDEMSLCRRIAAAGGLDSSAQALDPTIGLPELARAGALREGQFELVLLLGEPEAVAAARNWHQAVWRLEGFVRGRDTGAEEWQRANLAAQTARDRFADCARTGLGISGGVVSAESWPHYWRNLPADPGSW